jgi:recombination protein RecT
MSTQQLKAVATGQTAQAKNPVASFSHFLDGFKSQVALALPKHMNPDRMCRLAVTAFSRDDKLQQCEPKSIIAGIVTAAQLGLEIGVNGQCYLLPYFDNRNNRYMAQLVPGWKGLTDLVSRSGRATVWTGAVYEGDEFDYQLGDSPFVRHRPGDEDNDPSKLTHVYAIGRVNGSNWPVIEVWRMSKVVKHRDKNNKVGKAHYSFKNLEMYARKVPLLQVLKYMPSSIELSNAVALSDAIEVGGRATIEGDFVTVTDPETGEITRGAPTSGNAAPAQIEGASLDLNELSKRIASCKDAAVLEIVADDVRSLPEGEDRQRLMSELEARDKVIAGGKQ